MMRPPPEIIARVDKAVAEFDAAIIDEPDSRPTTSSYSVILDAWKRFRSLIEDLDNAVDHPLAPEAPRILRTAAVLVSHDVHELAFWLSHVGMALEPSALGSRRRYSPRR